MKPLLLILAGIGMVMAGCANKNAVEKLLLENPEIVFNVIEKNPQQFIETLNKTIAQAKKDAREKANKEQANRQNDEFSRPKTPAVDERRIIFGSADAPITIVEYSDFQCPYCARGYHTIKQVVEEYGEKVRVVYKHLPLPFHQMAAPSAKYYEAIALQDIKKAHQFHDHIFDNQGDLQGGEDFLKKTAQAVGADMARLQADLESEVVKNRIQADVNEAREFGITGTPGFLINGVALKGAYPISEFKKIIDRHLEMLGK